MAPKPRPSRAQHSVISARAQQARSVCAPSTTPRPKKRKAPKVIRPRPARKRGQARHSRASSAAGKAARRTHSVRPRRCPARVSGNTLRSSGKEWPKLHGAWCMVHGAWCRAHAARAKQAASCVIPFFKGDRGDCLGIRKCPSRRNTRSLSESPLKMAASSARGAKARGCGCHPQEGGQRARLSEHGTKCAARVLARPADEACPRRLFLSPSAFFEPAKKVRKNCKW